VSIKPPPSWEAEALLLLASPALAWALLLGLVLRPATLKLGLAPSL
jgi:hypothetical protein